MSFWDFHVKLEVGGSLGLLLALVAGGALALLIVKLRALSHRSSKAQFDTIAMPPERRLQTAPAPAIVPPPGASPRSPQLIGSLTERVPDHMPE